MEESKFIKKVLDQSIVLICQVGNYGDPENEKNAEVPKELQKIWGGRTKGVPTNLLSPAKSPHEKYPKGKGDNIFQHKIDEININGWTAWCQNLDTLENQDAKRYYNSKPIEIRKFAQINNQKVYVLFIHKEPLKNKKPPGPKDRAIKVQEFSKKGITIQIPQDKLYTGKGKGAILLDKLEMLKDPKYVDLEGIKIYHPDKPEYHKKVRINFWPSSCSLVFIPPKMYKSSSKYGKTKRRLVAVGRLYNYKNIYAGYPK